MATPLLAVMMARPGIAQTGASARAPEEDIDQVGVVDGAREPAIP